MNDNTPLKISKSERKRQMHALQKLGQTLVELSDALLNAIPLDPELLEAIRQARTLTQHEAKRRQLQYIGRLMRQADPEPIQQALQHIQVKHHQSIAKFHLVEEWRDRLIASGDTELQLFLQQFPQADAQPLRQLIRNAQQEKAKPASQQNHSKKLFQYLRSMIIG